ncbi:pyroglutamyl peptidase-like protein type I [Bimuria novae-zelandiae CBS 107.79]|uniref:Pyroglutamyl peptidase-like protein type I n=1 Tax=Bimuria novae-zelandiae CBS 107.79 TaxID=1447943 RepID=A0A6A5VJH3_9PLEO|nr:pyroglutamyl peptidase-like protein type I [Bimuria novae-zelandiae CBS 107.79]
MPRAASSTARQPPPGKAEEPVTVLVTGYGPFLEKYPRNSSWEIASTLPALLPSTPTSPTPIHIHVHYEPIRVAYNAVLDLVPRLLPPGSPLRPHPDIILHIGLAAGRSFFTLEQGAHSRGYGRIPDVDGEKFLDRDADAKFPSDLFPPVLQTSFDTADALARWRKYLKYSRPDADPAAEGRPDVRISPDAGNFMCGFIYYNSLATYFEQKEDERPVAFMHVPDLSDREEKLEEGREVAIALIRALVESRRLVGVVDGSVQGKRNGHGERVAAGMDVNFA